MRTRRPLWKVLVFGLGGLLVAAAAVVGGIVWDAHRRADAAMERGRRETTALLAAFRARDASRPVLDGPPIDGNAWEIYQAVLPVLGALPQAEQDEIAEVAGDWTPDRRADDEVLDVLYLKYAPEIGRLREGLRRRIVDPNYPFENTHGIQYPLLSPSIATAKFLVGGAAHAHRMGRGGESLDLAAMGLALAEDMGRRGAVINLLVALVCEGYACRAVLEALAESRYRPVELEVFAARLDRLDAQRPSPREAWDGEEIFLLSSLSFNRFEDYPAQVRLLDVEPGLRQLYSWRLLQAGALSEIPGQMERGRRLIALPAPERMAQLEQVLQEHGKGQKGLASRLAGPLFRSLRNDVEVQALRTLLRAAVAVAWYEAERGAFPASLDALLPRYLAQVPSCPYSGKPLSTKGGQVWSTGADGIDDGGKASPDDPHDFHKPGCDVVATVKRRS